MPTAATPFFVLSKVLGWFAYPSNAIGFIGLVGLLLMPTRWAKAGRRLVAVAFILLAVCGFTPLGRWLMLPLEERFPPWQPQAGPPAGIIVLGGAIDGRLSAARGVPLLRGGAERITGAVALARQYPQARIVYSGGSGRLLLDGAMEADVARTLFAELGIAASRIEMEDVSRNTAENAAASKAVAKPKPGERWILVTSAAHMPRAVGVFRRVGFPVEPYPVGWRTAGPGDVSVGFYYLSRGLRMVDQAAREWVGLIVYWLSGRTSELFPGPAPGRDIANAPEACRRGA